MTPETNELRATERTATASPANFAQLLAAVTHRFQPTHLDYDLRGSLVACLPVAGNTHCLHVELTPARTGTVANRLFTGKVTLHRRGAGVDKVLSEQLADGSPLNAGDVLTELEAEMGWARFYSQADRLPSKVH